MIPLSAKFAIVFAILGLIVSSVFGLLSGNRIEHTVFVIVVCTVVSGGLGFGTYSVLQAKIPEFFQIFEAIEGFSGRSQSEVSEFREEELNEFGNEIDMQQGEPVAVESADQPPAQHFGDHILVDKVKIKNEPHLMAQAIRTLLSKDD
ncbi:MAG: hypothetical protein H3C43_10375 [Leptonema sp. (in: Bacteria)]|nr:hypothetical protein [Leptonema sp. (in: bacteria)]